MNCKRQDTRKEVVRPIYFQGDSNSENFAFSVNVSECGLCMITNKDISIGDAITLYSRFFWGEPQRAMAVWTEEVNDKTRKIGLSLCMDS